eukprot:3368373-Lingulodinium_polyedra.AAC.1
MRRAPCNLHRAAVAVRRVLRAARRAPCAVQPAQCSKRLALRAVHYVPARCRAGVHRAPCAVR